MHEPNSNFNIVNAPPSVKSIQFAVVHLQLQQTIDTNIHIGEFPFIAFLMTGIYLFWISLLPIQQWEYLCHFRISIYSLFDRSSFWDDTILIKLVDTTHIVQNSSVFQRKSEKNEYIANHPKTQVQEEETKRYRFVMRWE